jgi:hypothetical protein
MPRLPRPSDTEAFPEGTRAAVRHILQTRHGMPPPSRDLTYAGQAGALLSDLADHLRSHTSLTAARASDAASGARQRPARLRRLRDDIEEVVQVHRRVERGHAALPGEDRRGEQRVHLLDVERVATRAVGRDIHEALGDGQVAQRVVATRALQAQRLAVLRRDIAGHNQRAFPPVDL